MSRKHVIQLSMVLILLVATFATSSRASALSSCSSTYTVQRGDWLAKIARHCGVTLSALYAANPWVGYYIYPGQLLTIPGGYGPVWYCGPSYDSYGSYYVVCRGDTLGGIALYYGVAFGTSNSTMEYPMQTGFTRGR